MKNWHIYLLVIGAGLGAVGASIRIIERVTRSPKIEQVRPVYFIAYTWGTNTGHKVEQFSVITMGDGTNTTTADDFWSCRDNALLQIPESGRTNFSITSFTPLVPRKGVNP